MQLVENGRGNTLKVTPHFLVRAAGGGWSLDPDMKRALRSVQKQLERKAA